MINCSGLVAVAFYAELVHQRSTGTDAVQLDNIIKGLTSSSLLNVDQSSNVLN